MTDETQESIAEEERIPQQFYLYSNYPNPFNPSTSIVYDLPKSVFVRLVVYDLLGNEVATLVEKKQNAGSYTVKWDGLSDFGRQMPTGIYIYRIQAGNFSSYKKMLLIK